MKKIIFICFLLCTLECTAVAFAEETVTANAEGIALYTIDDNDSDERAAESSWQDKAQEVLINALSLTGIKYTYGGSNPNTGFDCSGFVRYVFRNAANLTLPPTARAIAQIGKTVKKDELKPGDLVFFNTLKSAFSHVGIYIGNNKFIHAPSTGKTVRVESMQTSYWASRFDGGQRLEKEAEKESEKAEFNKN
jgi:cell wall-associated NlpC family hydrolase